MLSEMTGKKTSEKEPRHKSKLILAAEERMREMLLKTLAECRWSPSATSEALDMGGRANVLRTIRNLGIQEIYDAERLRLGLRPGRPPQSEEEGED